MFLYLEGSRHTITYIFYLRTRRNRVFQKKGKKSISTLCIGIFTQITCQQNLNSNHCQRSTWCSFFFLILLERNRKNISSLNIYYNHAVDLFMCCTNTLFIASNNEFTRSRRYSKKYLHKTMEVKWKKKKIIKYKLLAGWSLKITFEIFRQSSPQYHPIWEKKELWI